MAVCCAAAGDGNVNAVARRAAAPRIGRVGLLAESSAVMWGTGFRGDDAL
jgi:hypothetical protein